MCENQNDSMNYENAKVQGKIQLSVLFKIIIEQLLRMT